MSNKPSGKLSNWRVASYSFGDVANNLSFQMTSMFLMVYMTDIVGISAALAGTIYGVTKIWAGVTDLLAGSTVDRARTRWGRLRPWILWGSTPLALAFVLLFSTPAGLSPGAAFVWILLLDAAFQLCYSFVNIPYGSLAAAMTQDAVDRSRLTGSRSIGGAITGVVLSAVVAPQFQNTAADDVRFKFTITCIILGVLAVVLYLICFSQTREVVPRSPGKVKLADTLKMVGKNRPLIVLCVGAFFLLSAQFTMNAVALYYTRYVLGNAGYFTLLMLSQTIGTILAASFVPLITARMGKRRGYTMFAFMAVIGYAIVVAIQQGGTALMLGIIAWFFLGMGTGGTNALMFSMQADTVDYGEWKTGTRSEGGSYSILSFVRKCGQGIGGFVGAAVIGAFNYVPKAPEQTPEAIWGIKVATGVVPGVLGIIAALIIIVYPLTEQAHRDLVVDLNERRDERVRAEVGAEAATVAASGRPVVTFFEQYGAGADEIARKVADRLGVAYIGQRITSEQLERPEEADLGDARVNQFFRSVAFTGQADTDVHAAAADREADTELLEQNTREVLEATREGGVLLGRNATIVLADQPKSLHVRLTAPLDHRIGRAAQAAGISTEQAALRQVREDAARVEMSQRLYNWDPSDDGYYDLVINTGKYSTDDAVQLILDAFKAKTN